MTLNETQIKYLTDELNRLNQLISTPSDGTDELVQKKFQASRRGEAALLMLNICGYRYDYKRKSAYKIVQNEEREYVE